MSALVDYPTLIRDLYGKMQTRASGTMFIKTDDNHSITIALQDGIVITAISGALLGRMALEYFAKVERASYVFKNQIFRYPNSAPSPDDVAQLLQIQVNSQAASSATPVLQPGNRDFHERAVHIIKTQLMKNLGPVGSVLVDDALESLSSLVGTLDEARSFAIMMSKEIDHPDEAEQFIHQTADQLERL